MSAVTTQSGEIISTKRPYNQNRWFKATGWRHGIEIGRAHV